MNDTRIEHLLRNAPKVSPPPQLLAQLRSQIALEKPADKVAFALTPWWKRWVPALSFGVLIFACLVVIGVQTTELLALRNENESLDRQLQASAAPSLLESATDDSQDVATRVEEAQNLRTEIEQLNQQLRQIQELQKQNEALRTQIAAANAKTNTEDPFAAEKAKAERIACINNIKQICLAARMWSNDHGDVFPMDVMTMQKELNRPKILTCPSDAANLPAQTSWENFDPGKVSYEWLAAGHPEGTPEEVIVRCRIHSNAGMADGSAQQFNPDSVGYVTENGILKLKRRAVSFE